MSSTDAPIPLSFPAAIQNPGLLDKLRELSLGEGSATTRPAPAPARRSKRGENVGKRWTRRKDNAGLVGNPHMVSPSRRDWSIPQPDHRSTFPEPLPAYLPRTVKVPSVTYPPPQDTASANAGRFTLGLKGMRRELRRSGYRTQVLVQEVEQEILSWLEEGGVLLNPDDTEDVDPSSGALIGQLEAIREVTRTPLKLIWKVENPSDAFARYVIHCCARYYQVVSYSKDVDGVRLTYLLRPNVTRPDFTSTRGTLETPPTTDLEQSSYSYVDSSDFSSDQAESEDESRPLADGPRSSLSAIEEDGSASEAERPQPRRSSTEDWLLLGTGSDVEAEDEYSDVDMSRSVESLDDEPSFQSGLTQTLAAVGESGSEADPDTTIRSSEETPSSTHRLSRRDELLWDRRRSSSSPSRSPARRTPRRRANYRRNHGRNKPHSHLQQQQHSSSFYEYLFS